MQEKMTGTAKGARGRPRTFDRQLALCNALRVFWENGFEQSTLKQLTEAMGIASPSIYCAFGNKCDLFLEALQYYRSTYWEPEFKNFLQAEDLLEGLIKLLTSTVDILLSPAAPCGCLAIFTAVSLPAKENRIKELVQKMRANTKSVFEKKIELAWLDGQLRPETNRKALAGALTNFFEGLALQSSQIKNREELLEIALAGISLLYPFYIPKANRL